MTLFTGEEELVLSTERFANELKSVSCKANSSITMTFLSNTTFQTAVASWSWVNFSENRTFILIANSDGCSMDNTRQPWVVSNANYDPSNLVVHLSATQSSWPEIAHTFTLDFGKYKRSSPSSQKRSLIDTTKSFSIDLSRPLPQGLLPAKSLPDILPSSVLNNFDFTIDCDNCSSKGTLEFQGHVESNLFKGLSDFTMTVIPHGFEADLDLKVKATGTAPTTKWGHQWDLFTVGIPGLSIPDILQLGPNLDFSAGFNVEKLTGSVNFAGGVKGAVPDTSTAEIDLVKKKTMGTSGWKPLFTSIPFSIDGEVDFDFDLYIAVSVQLSLTAMSEQKFSRE
jgi:Domain of unknown function (DUF7029)